MVVGDRVRVVGDVSGTADALARIVRIADRTSVLTRTADDEESAVEGRFERVVVANADQLVIVSSLRDPQPRTGFIDRCLVAAYNADIDPLLCLTKADLAGPADVLDYYAELDLPFVLCRPDRPLTELHSALDGRISVMIGHSGVGKSTLVNRLVPHAARTVGKVSAIGKGRHTSTSVVAMPLRHSTSSHRWGGWIIDTPGIRSFGLGMVSPESLLHGFPDLIESSVNCPPNCDHTGTAGTAGPAADPAVRAAGAASGGRVATTCGLDRLVAAGGADPRRLASYRRLLASRTGETPT